MEGSSGFSSNLSVGQTAPVTEVEGGQGQIFPRPGERDSRGRESPAEKASADPILEGASEGGEAEDLEEEVDPPPHRVDSLA